MIHNLEDTQLALQENIAIAAQQMTAPGFKYRLSPLTIDDAMQIGAILWQYGYRKTGEDTHV